MQADGRAAIVIAAIAAILSGCGQKGPLTLPGEASAPVATEPGGDTTDDEEQEQD